MLRHIKYNITQLTSDRDNVISRYQSNNMPYRRITKSYPIYVIHFFTYLSVNNYSGIAKSRVTFKIT